MTRTGFGYDVHRLVAGRPLVLGGVVIPSDLGLVGHSDADVLLHAIADALLGAAAIGDIGSHFPDTDDRYRGADSGMLLGEVVRLVGESGFVISNVDATVALQQPKLLEHIQAIREKIAAILGVGVGQVSVKATTTERLGFVGDRSGASAYAVCTIEDGPARPRKS